jgi:hypothetical protein
VIFNVCIQLSHFSIDMFLIWPDTWSVWCFIFVVIVHAVDYFGQYSIWFRQNAVVSILPAVNWVTYLTFTVKHPKLCVYRCSTSILHG